VRLTAPEGLTAIGDVALLTTLVAQLLGNAWKFTAGVEAAEVELGFAGDADPTFWVRDNGAGFDPASAGRLFSPFQRMHPAEAFPGIGMGLAIVRRIVHRHGGRVWADAAVGRGATVSWTLPARAVVRTS